MRVKTRTNLPHAFADDPASAWEEDLFTVFNGGDLDKARLGRIPRAFAKAIGCSTTIVYLSRASVQKIRGKHPEIKFTDVLALNSVFQSSAWVGREGRGVLAFAFVSPTNKSRTIKVILKSSNHGTEVFLRSMYPIGKRRLKALRAKTLTLREES